MSRLLLVASFIVAWFNSTTPPDTRLHVTPVASEGNILLSFELADGLSEETGEAIRSGLPTTITYDVELRRPVALGWGRTIAAVSVAATVRFDNLTRLNRLSRAIDGRVEDSRETDDPNTVRRWMTVFERVPLFRTVGLEPNGEYDVRVHARTSPQSAWPLWPWEAAAVSGSASFTFVP